jgi:hypothetical protein
LARGSASNGSGSTAYSGDFSESTTSISDSLASEDDTEYSSSSSDAHPVSKSTKNSSVDVPYSSIKSAKRNCSGKAKGGSSSSKDDDTD